jgi:hypothetical protein
MYKTVELSSSKVVTIFRRIFIIGKIHFSGVFINMDSSFPKADHMECSCIYAQIINIPYTIIKYLLRVKCTRFSKGIIKEVESKILDHV